MTVQPNTTTAQQATEYVDPTDLICPGCTEQVRCEPPGYWRVAWGLPAPGVLPRGRDGPVPGAFHRPPGRTR